MYLFDKVANFDTGIFCGHNFINLWIKEVPQQKSGDDGIETQDQKIYIDIQNHQCLGDNISHFPISNAVAPFMI